MKNTNQNLIDQRLHDLNDDGVDRRGFLKCMAWAGTGLVWTMSGGVPVSRAFARGFGKACWQRRGLQFRSDQRQSHRIQQTRESGRHRHAAGGNRQDQCVASISRIS